MAEALQIEQHGHLAAGVGGEPDGVLSELIGQAVAIGHLILVFAEVYEAEFGPGAEGFARAECLAALGASADADPHFKAGKLDMRETAMPMLPPDRRRGRQEACTCCLVDADIHQIRLLILDPAAIGGYGR